MSENKIGLGRRVIVFIVSLIILYFYNSFVIAMYYSAYYGMTQGWSGDTGESALGFVGIAYGIILNPILSLLIAIFYKSFIKHIKLIISAAIIIFVGSLVASAYSQNYMEKKILNRKNFLESKINNEYADFADLSYIGSEKYRIDPKTKILYYLNGKGEKYRRIDKYQIKDRKPINFEGFKSNYREYELFKINEGYILGCKSYDKHSEKFYFVPNVSKNLFYETKLNYSKLTKNFKKESVEVFGQKDLCFSEYKYEEEEYGLYQSFTDLFLFKALLPGIYKKVNEFNLPQLIRTKYPDSKYLYSTYDVKIDNKFIVRAVLNDKLEPEIVLCEE